MDGSFIILFLLTVFLVAIIYYNIKKLFDQPEDKKFTKSVSFSYFAKRLPMTQPEVDFFFKLNRVVSERYYIFPQMHLSAILDHKVKGQDWRHAFRHINGKSVDFVLCDKTSLRPTYAIELDDTTHDSVDRRERDIEVERILKQANLPLVRISSRGITEEELTHALSSARSKVDW